MQSNFAGHQFVVRHLNRLVFLTAVRRAYGCALRFVEKSDALCAFVRSHIEVVIALGRMRFTFEFPIDAAFVDSVIRALSLARTAADAIVNDFDWHNFRCLLLINIDLIKNFDVTNVVNTPGVFKLKPLNPGRFSFFLSEHHIFQTFYGSVIT